MKLTQKRVRKMMWNTKQKLRNNLNHDLSVKVSDGSQGSTLAVGLPVENPVDGGLGDLQPFGERDLTKAGSGLDLGEHLGRGLVHGNQFYTRSDTQVNTRTTRKLPAVYTRPYILEMTKTIADRLDQLMQIRGVRSQSELARRSGVPQATISRTLKGGSVPEMETVKKLAEALSSTSSWLVDGLGEPPESPDHLTSIPKVVRARTTDSAQNLPLFHESVSSNRLHTGDVPKSEETENVSTAPQYSIDKNDFRPVFVVERPQEGMPERLWDEDRLVGVTDQFAMLATKDARAFIVPVLDDSMFPRLMPGEYVLVQPSRAPEIEDTVLVRLSNGATLLKRLLSRRDGHIRLGAWNDPTIHTYPERDVSWLFAIAHSVPPWMLTSSAP